jgi:hypothetical protein
MNKSQTSSAAKALVDAVTCYEGKRPSVSSPVWRKVITDSLGIKKLYTTRLNKILDAATALGLTVCDESFILEKDNKDSVEPLKNKADVIPIEDEKLPRHEVLGRLLEGQLRDRSVKLRRGQAASITFCLCPNCGTELKMSGVLEESS